VSASLDRAGIAGDVGAAAVPKFDFPLSPSKQESAPSETLSGCGTMCAAQIPSGLCLSRVKTRSSDDVRCMTGLPLKAEVRPRVCYVAEVPRPAV